MLKISSCIDILFKELDFYGRFEAAKNAGTDFVEFWGWAGRDIGRIKELCGRHDLKITAMCVSTAKPETGAIFNPKKLLYRDGEAVDAFISALEESIGAAKQLEVPSLILTVGNERNDVTRYEQHANIVLALKKCAPLLEDAGITLVIEPLNTLVNHRGYFLPSSYEAFAVCEETGSPNIKVLYDIYHQQITEGNIIANIRKYINLIGHFHLADVPGRVEPGLGELNFPNIFKAIAETGYDKYVGLEYQPTADCAHTIRQVLTMAEK